jgi:predicted dienelactone hydrolase
VRPLEILLLAADLLALAVMVVPLSGRARVLRRLLPPLVPLAVGAHLVVEGPRWQMVPAYVLGGLLLVAWLLAALPTTPRADSRTRRIGRIAGGSLAVLGLGLSVVLPAAVPVFRFPRPSGPYGIGTVTYHWVDTDRPEMFTADPNDRRELMVQVWYPAEPDPSAGRAAYVPDPQALAPLARLLGLPGFVLSHLRHVTTNAVPSARVAQDEPRYPVLVFSHGRGGFRQHNTRQIEELVSHGYVVAAVDHPYAAAGVVFPDGRVVAIDPGMTGSAADEAQGAAMDATHPYFARDIVFTLDQLAAIDRADPYGVLTGRLDLARAGVFGVSLGGGVAAEACRQDERLRACLIMDMHMPPDLVRAGLRQPTMWISRDAETMRQEGWPQTYIDEVQTSMRAVYERLPGDGYLVLVPGMYHSDFSDARLLSPLTSLVGLTGPIDGERAHDILRSYTLAFFDRHVKGDPAPLLDGPSPEYPEVRFESRPS